MLPLLSLLQGEHSLLVAGDPRIWHTKQDCRPVHAAPAGADAGRGAAGALAVEHGIGRYHPGDGFAAAGDNDFFAGSDPVEQLAELGFRLEGPISFIRAIAPPLGDLTEALSLK
jgi:hypothetical protein